MFRNFSFTASRCQDFMWFAFNGLSFHYWKSASKLCLLNVFYYNSYRKTIWIFYSILFLNLLLVVSDTESERHLLYILLTVFEQHFAVIQIYLSIRAIRKSLFDLIVIHNGVVLTHKPGHILQDMPLIGENLCSIIYI